MINNTALTTSNTTVYTSTGQSAINLMLFCNTDDTNIAELTVFVVPNGDSPADINTIIKRTQLSTLETITFSTEKLILDDGDTVVAKATQLDGSSAVTTVVSTVSSINL